MFLCCETHCFADAAGIQTSSAGHWLWVIAAQQPQPQAVQFALVSGSIQRFINHQPDKAWSSAALLSGLSMRVLWTSFMLSLLGSKPSGIALPQSHHFWLGLGSSPGCGWSSQQPLWHCQQLLHAHSWTHQSLLCHFCEEPIQSCSRKHPDCQVHSFSFFSPWILRGSNLALQLEHWWQTLCIPAHQGPHLWIPHWHPSNHQNPLWTPLFSPS